MKRPDKRKPEYNSTPEWIHIAKIERPHVSQEFRERGQIEAANEMISHLRPPFKAAATGVNGNYSYEAMPVIGPRKHLLIKGLGL